MSFPRYPRYKDSGVEWLGEVPEHWDSSRLKEVASYNDDVLEESNPPHFEIGYVDISSVQLGVGINTIERMPFSLAPSRARRRVQHGDVIISTVRTYLRAVAAIRDPDENLIVSTGFAVIRPRSRLVSEFLGYAVSADYFIDQVIARSTGISYPAINARELVNIPIALPPVPEQAIIASFLDRETAKIDALIAEQRRLIEILNEKQQVIISDAITKGLNPDVPMKPSGIEWLGEVPAHWTIERGRYLFRKLDLAPVVGDGVVTAFRDGQVTLRENRRIDGFTVAILETGYQRVRAGDLVIHGMDAFAGAIGVSDSTGKCTPEYSVLNPARQGVDNSYYAAILRLMARRNFILVICPSVRERAPRFRFEAFKEVMLPVPPLDEQVKIVDLLETESRSVASLTCEAERAIALLQERRTALISAAVTGKIDVRGLAEGA